MTLDEFNRQDPSTAKAALLQCCGSEKWARIMMKHFPFATEQQLIRDTADAWYHHCEAQDWMQAFAQHQRIGDVKSLADRFAGAEQAGVAKASPELIRELAEANQAYEEKFNFIFIVCATGRSAAEMLRLCTDRLQNTYHEELHIAMGEQHKITIIRLKKLLSSADWTWMRSSQLTTHVLDTSAGSPGAMITIRLMEQQNGSTWQTMAQGITNADGRIADLLPAERLLVPGSYKLVFDTGGYFRQHAVKGFYPMVEIQFTIADEQHYHVPLLINPFGYSTYRGS